MPSVYETMTPEQRTARAKKAAAASWSNTKDRTARTAKARQALMEKFETEEARSEYFTQIAKRPRGKRSTKTPS